MAEADIGRMFNDPKTQGTLPDADVEGVDGLPGEGPFMRMSLRFSGEVVAAARFETYGCPYAVACGSWVTQWVSGRPVEQAERLTSNDLILLLGGLPLGKEHCAVLAVNSLRDGLTQWREQQEGVTQ